MSTRKTRRLSALVITVLVLLAGSVFARQPRVPMPFDWSLMPASLPAAPGPFGLQFSLSATDYCRDCKEAIITVTTKGSLVYSGSLTWTVPLSEDVPYTTVLPVVLPPDDTGSIHLRVQSGRFVRNVRRWFVSTREIVTVMVGDPRTAPRRGPSYWEQLRASSTAEQLQQIVDVRIDLREEFPRRLKMVLELVGDLKPTEEDSVFTARLSRDDVLTLNGWGVICDVLRQPPPPPPVGRRIARYGDR